MAAIPLEIIGWVGTVFVLGAYFLLQIKRLGPTSKSYNTLNLVGAFFSSELLLQWCATIVSPKHSLDVGRNLRNREFSQLKAKRSQIIRVYYATLHVCDYGHL